LKAHRATFSSGMLCTCWRGPRDLVITWNRCGDLIGVCHVGARHKELPSIRYKAGVGNIPIPDLTS
jgi:hypothetical protein